MSEENIPAVWVDILTKLGIPEDRWGKTLEKGLIFRHDWGPINATSFLVRAEDLQNVLNSSESCNDCAFEIHSDCGDSFNPFNFFV